MFACVCVRVRVRVRAFVRACLPRAGSSSCAKDAQDHLLSRPGRASTSLQSPAKPPDVCACMALLSHVFHNLPQQTTGYNQQSMDSTEQSGFLQNNQASSPLLPSDDAPFRASAPPLRALALSPSCVSPCFVASTPVAHPPQTRPPP